MLSKYSDKKIGGPGLTVEIDESLFGLFVKSLSFLSDQNKVNCFTNILLVAFLSMENFYILFFVFRQEKI